jgi:hypothetical protein
MLGPAASQWPRSEALSSVIEQLWPIMATRSSVVNTRIAVVRVVVLGAVGVACFRMHVGEAVSEHEPTAAHATELRDVSDSESSAPLLTPALIKPTGVVRRNDPGLGMLMTSEHEGSLRSVRAQLLVVVSVHRCSKMNISSHNASVARHACGWHVACVGACPTELHAAWFAAHSTLVLDAHTAEARNLRPSDAVSLHWLC